MTFQAIVARQDGDRVTAAVETVEDDVFTAGDVTISIEWSNINYKDAIALAGQKIIQTFPLIPGIDFAGTVESSDDPRFKTGDKVVATGWGLSQTHNGGFAQKGPVPADWLVKLAAPISTRDAMAIGTAGFTAMLSVLTLEHGGVSPDKGELLVTGASGGRRPDFNRPSFEARLPRRRVHRQGFGGAISERSRSSNDPRQGDAERRRSADLG